MNFCDIFYLVPIYVDDEIFLLNVSNMKRRTELLLSPLAFRGAAYYVAEKAQVWSQMLLNFSCVTLDNLNKLSEPGFLPVKNDHIVTNIN